MFGITIDQKAYLVKALLFFRLPDARQPWWEQCGIDLNKWGLQGRRFVHVKWGCFGTSKRRPSGVTSIDGRCGRGPNQTISALADPMAPRPDTERDRRGFMERCRKNSTAQIQTREGTGRTGRRALGRQMEEDARRGNALLNVRRYDVID